MIQKIKENIESHIGDRVKIIFNGSRNKVEEYDAVIEEMYPYIFTVKINSDDSIVKKSFTYSDVLTETIELIFDIV